MLSQIKKLLGQSAVYGLGLMGTSIALMVLTPIFLHRLSPAEYGMNEMLATFSSMLYNVMLLGVASVLIKVYINDCQSQQERRDLVSSMVVFTFALGGVIVAAAWVLAPLLSQWLLKDSHHGYLVRLAATGSALLLVQQMTILCIRARQQPWLFAAVALSQLAVTIGLNFYFVWHKGMGVTGIQIASISAAGISLIMGLIMIRSEIALVFSPRLVKYVLLIGYPLIPASIVPWVLNVSDRYYLNYYWGLNQTGLYAVGYKIGMLGIQIFVMAFQLAWTPLFFASRTNDDAPRLCANVLKYYLLVLLSSGLMLSVFAPEILRVLADKQFRGASWIVPYISLAYVFYGAQFFVVPVFVGANKNKLLGIMMLGMAVLNTALNLILIPRSGASGAIGATMITFAAWVFASFILANKFYPVPYPKLDFVKMLLAALVVYMGFSQIHGLSVQNGLIKLLSIPVFITLLLVLRFFGERELALIHSLPGKAMSRMNSRYGKAA
jgi:O-antigen/teichoic acid export membrane protein